MALDNGAERLRFSSDLEPGISRHREGDGFRYVDARGRVVRAAEVLERIRELAIPPAYTRVWICADPSGHLQATGRDARGRKQYRYHPRFRELQELSKFHRLVAFGEALPRIRATIEADLRLKGDPKRKVLAVVVSLLDHTLIRVGNEEYAKENHSYGLTTMLSRHVTIEGSHIRFCFPGKSKVQHAIDLKDKRIARLVAKIDELPGQHLFHYIDEDGDVKGISSSDVNEYLHEIAGEECSAKDFRTWWGTVLGFCELSSLEAPKSDRESKRAILSAIKAVAAHLGNTPAVCRKCYVHPEVIRAFRRGTLCPPGATRLEDTEMRVLHFLRSVEDQKNGGN